ncbi:MAG: NUDIX hydrolase [Candidatus Obscuribacterales bacterium]|nr:NUDIX hydrolase [Candidatus Obscuribacterales bacterium]
MVLYNRNDVIGTERIFDGYIFNVRRDFLKKPDQEPITREVVEHNGGVVICGQPDPDKVILIRQYRFAVDEEIIELPAGRVELGEDRFVAAKRELTEETGYFATTWKELPPMYSAPGFCNELLTFYQATDLTWQGKNLDADEETEVIIVTLKEAWKMVQQRLVRDAKTVAGIAVLCFAE